MSGNNSQKSILDFVESPNYNTVKNRVPRTLEKTKSVPRGSSSNSTSRKRKASDDHIDNPDKIIIMGIQQKRL